MRVTLFSFFISILWGSILIIFIHFCRKKTKIIRKFGVRSVLFLSFFSIVRMMIPCEFSFARVFLVQEIFDGFEKSVSAAPQKGGAKPAVLSILLLVWFCVSAALIVKFICRYLKSARECSKYPVCEEELCQRIFQQVLNESRTQAKITIRRSKYVSIPMGIGVFKKSILLPEEDYSEAQLYYILLHEYTHFKNRDLLAKIIVHVFSCIYWWNPTVYLFKKDLAQILEIKCDLDVTDSMGDDDKVRYLTTIVSVLKNVGARRRKEFYGATALVAGNYKSETVERFKIVSENLNGSNKLVTVSWFLALLVLFYSSYAFTVHPGYEAPGIIHIEETAPGLYHAAEEENFVDIMKKTTSSYAYLRGTH